MLDTHVLVLNKSWVAVNVTPARRALCLLFQGHARVVHPTDYSLHDFEDWCAMSRLDPDFARSGPAVATPTYDIRLPEVVLLSMFNGFVRHEVSFSRRNIIARDRHRCQYCGQRPAKQELTLDHVMPKSRGGKDSWENLVLACVHCNVSKADRTPEEAGMRLLTRPAAPHWLPRFGARLPKTELMSWQRFVDTRYWGIEHAS